MDGSVKIYDMNLAKVINELICHKGCCYQATWHPSTGGLISSVGSDGLLKIWDLNSNNKTIASVPAHKLEILSVDFSKYEELIATASIDKTISLWDLRNLKIPVNILQGHRYPVKKCKFSPHAAKILASGSYDMNLNVWDIAD
jgi:peroxin-7